MVEDVKNSHREETLMRVNKVQLINSVRFKFRKWDKVEF